MILFLAIGLGALFYMGGGWYLSGKVQEEALEAHRLDPADRQGGIVEAAEIDGSGAGRITLRPDGQNAADTSLDEAVVGIVVGESRVVAGPATVHADGRRTREVRDVVGQAPGIGDRYSADRDVWGTPGEAGLEFEEITVTTPEGEEFPAWVIPGKGRRNWAVLTHGKGATRAQMLRMARPLHAAGYNVLIISHRGDAGAPRYEEGMVTYGRVEWRELEAAVEYALDRGATRVLLGGAGHGGAVTLGLLDRSSVASSIDGVILDAPASSFEDLIDEAAEDDRLPLVGLPIPESLEDAAKLLVAWRYGIAYSEIDYTDMQGLIDVPLLVFQGSTDRTVPERVNDRLMDGGAGDAGDYVVVPGADHVLSWNLDPEAYEQRITDFVEGLGKAEG